MLSKSRTIQREIKHVLNSPAFIFIQKMQNSLNIKKLSLNAETKAGVICQQDIIGGMQDKNIASYKSRTQIWYGGLPLVEARGIEPLSEKHLQPFSPGAVCV